MIPQMRASLAAALKKQAEAGGPQSAEMEALKKIEKRNSLRKLTSTVKTIKDVSEVLEDPPLPSAADLDRWWPEPRKTMIDYPLVAYGPGARYEAELRKMQERQPVVLPKPPFLPLSPRPSSALDGMSPSPRSPRTLQLESPRTPTYETNSPPRSPPSPDSATRRASPWGGSVTARPRSPSKQASMQGSAYGSAFGSAFGSNFGSHTSRPSSVMSPRDRTSARPSKVEPSRNFGNPKNIQLPDDGQSLDAFDFDSDGIPRRSSTRPDGRPDSPPSGLLRPQDAALQLEAIDRSTRLAHWMDVFAADEEAFASKAVFVEMRLRQALSSSVTLGTPNTFRTAIVCDAFERVAPMTGRYEGVLVLCWKELIQSLYYDYTPDLPGSGAKVYAERTPFFLETKRLKELTQEQAKTMIRMKKQRDAELVALQARNDMINKTAERWNKALSGAAASKEADSLKLRIEALSQLLADASSEVARLHEEQYREPDQKLIEMWNNCESATREEVLVTNIFDSDETATVMTKSKTDEVALWLAHFLKKLPAEKMAKPGEATRGRVLQALTELMNLPADEKLPIAQKILKDHPDAKEVGEALAGVLVLKAGESVMSTEQKVPLYKQAMVGFTEYLEANKPAGYIPPPEDAKGLVKFQVLTELRKQIGVDPNVLRDAKAADPSSMMLASPPAKQVSFGKPAPTSAAAAAAEAAAARDRIAELKRRQAAGELTPEELAELNALEARLSELDAMAGGGFDMEAELRRRLAEMKAQMEREFEQRMIDKLAGMSDAERRALLAKAGSSSDDEAARLAELKRRQAAGELTPEEEAELRRLEAGKGGAGNGISDKDPSALSADEAAREAAAVKDRIADLKRRQALGQLTPEEEAELKRLEKRLNQLEAVASGIPLDPDEAAREAKRCQDRIAELKRRQAAGELTPEEMAELQALESKLAKLNAAADGLPIDPFAAQAEAKAVKDRIAELQRRKALGQLTPEEEAELKRLEKRLAKLESVANSIPTDPDAAAREAAAVKDRIADLQRRKALGQLTPEEEAELKRLEARLTELEKVSKKGGRGGYGGSGAGGGNTRDMETQTEKPGLTRQGTSGIGGGPESPNAASNKRSLPDRAVTSLCEIKFNRKDVKAMNTLMCRRLVSALYQVKVDANIEADQQGKPRQTFPDYVPDQFVVLYGIKSLAIKNINEFLYGVRAERYRKNAEGNQEFEPLLMPFWRATHHGVPLEERMRHEDFEFYLDLISCVAKTVGEEHTLQLKSIGAFWNMLGSMAEIQLPVFVLLNVLSKMYEKAHKELFERLKKLTTNAAAAWTKLCKDPKTAPKPCPSYKPTILGKPELDSRGHLPLGSFMNLCMEGMDKQKEKDSKILEGVWATWEKHYGEASFDVFVECFKEANPDLPEADVIHLYQLATSGENPDSPEFKLIDTELRKRNITLKRKGGMEAVQAMKMDDIKTLSKTTTLFSTKPKPGGLAAAAAKAGGGDAEPPPEPAPPPAAEEPASPVATRERSRSWKRANTMKTMVALAKPRNIRELLQEMEEEAAEAE